MDCVVTSGVEESHWTHLKSSSERLMEVTREGRNAVHWICMDCMVTSG